MSPYITPSILSADFTDLAGEVARIPGADLVHVDVMDNHFVPNLTIGLPVVKQLVDVSPVPVDAHLMITDADEWAPAYAEAGCASVSFHAEATRAPVRLARQLREMGVRAGIALRPVSPVEPFLDHLEEFDMVLAMTVEPGFGGQGFLDTVLPKVTRARQAIDAGRDDTWLQVDGGISRDTIEAAARAGADVFVAGSAVYGADDPAAEIEALRQLAAAARLA